MVPSSFDSAQLKQDRWGLLFGSLDAIQIDRKARFVLSTG
jgi:hypothetical protein